MSNRTIAIGAIGVTRRRNSGFE